MKDTNIIDFFTHRSYEDITAEDYKENDELARKYGVYVGCLMKKDSDKLRMLKAQLKFKCEQLEQLTLEYEQLCSEYEELRKYCVWFLSKDNREVNKFNIPDDWFMVDENAQVWIIPEAYTPK